MGIKSFQGAREEVKKVYNAPILVKDYMTKKLVVFSPQQSILEVMDLLIKHRISGGPVCDNNGKLVGMISESRCMKPISESRYFNMPILEKGVEHFMDREFETISSEMDIFDAATYFHKLNRRRLPVMEDGELVGQISRKDIMTAALKLTGQSWR